MTPLQAAKAHCANYQPDGSCLGIYYLGNLNIDEQRCRPLPKCLLTGCQACPYFEETVLPQVPISVAERYRNSLPAGANTTVKPLRGDQTVPGLSQSASWSLKRDTARNALPSASVSPSVYTCAQKEV